MNEYYAKIEAWNDWQKLAKAATARGYERLVKAHQPGLDMSARQVSARSNQLRQAIIRAWGEQA